MTDRIEVYQGTDKAFRWRLKAANGEVIASGEGHTRLSDARRAAKRVNPGAEIVVLPDDLYDPNQDALEDEGE